MVKEVLKYFLNRNISDTKYDSCIQTLKIKMIKKFFLQQTPNNTIISSLPFIMKQL